MVSNRSLETALTACVVMACSSRTRFSAAALAKAAGVEGASMQKALRPLIGAGLVQARRGVGGGYELSVPVGEVTVGEVCDALDPPTGADGGRSVHAFVVAQERRRRKDLHAMRLPQLIQWMDPAEVKRLVQAAIAVDGRTLRSDR